jgi:hypothetical protein
MEFFQIYYFFQMLIFVPNSNFYVNFIGRDEGGVKAADGSTSDGE